MKDYILYICENKPYISTPDREKIVRDLMVKNHAPESEVECYDIPSYELLETLKLNELYTIPNEA